MILLFLILLNLHDLLCSFPCLIYLFQHSRFFWLQKSDSVAHKCHVVRLLLFSWDKFVERNFFKILIYRVSMRITWVKGLVSFLNLSFGIRAGRLSRCSLFLRSKLVQRVRIRLFSYFSLVKGRGVALCVRRNWFLSFWGCVVSLRICLGGFYGGVIEFLLGGWHCIKI